MQAEIPQTAIILAGGLGTRLRPIVVDQPKVLANVAGRPFLDYLLAYLAGQGVQRIILSLGYLADRVQTFVSHGQRWKLVVEYAVEGDPLGTGGGLKYASQMLRSYGSAGQADSHHDNSTEEAFFALNGDTLFQVDLASLWRCHWQLSQKAQAADEKAPLATLALRSLQANSKDQYQRGCVKLEANGRIRAFDEKPVELTESLLTTGKGSSSAAQVMINGGVYVLTPQALEYIPVGQPSSLEGQIFPLLAKSGQLAGCSLSGYFVDIGTPSSLAAFEADVHGGFLGGASARAITNGRIKS